jgi:archaemetzincin
MPRVLRAAVVLLVLFASHTASAEVVYIQLLGRELPDADVTFVRESLARFYGFEVRLLPRVDLPQSAWTAPRERWRAEKLLEFLGPRLPQDGFRILGLTGADISTTKGDHADWGIFGLGTIEGTTCVISSFRLGRNVTKLQARVRLGKVAVHEIGHTLGLKHCPNAYCLMEDAKGKVATTDRDTDLCQDCRAKLAERGRSFPKSPDDPWKVP